MSDITFKMTAATNVGLVRSNNEDNFIVTPDLSKADNWFVPGDSNEVFPLGENGCVLVVADGMGGMNAGEVASQIAIDTVKFFFSPGKITSKIASTNNGRETYLSKVIIAADEQIKQMEEKIANKKDDFLRIRNLTVLRLLKVVDLESLN